MNLQRASHSLSRSLPGPSFSPYSMLANWAEFSLSACPLESFRNTSDKVTLIPSSFSHVIVQSDSIVGTDSPIGRAAISCYLFPIDSCSSHSSPKAVAFFPKLELLSQESACVLRYTLHLSK